MCSHRSYFLAVSLVLVVTNGLPGVEPIQPAKQEQEISKLLTQLGSADFQEREGASQALIAIGPPALETLRRAAATGKDAEVRRRAVRLIERIENSLEQLLLDYRAFGLPLPPDHAPLVRLERGSGTVNGKELPPTYRLVFLLRPGTLPARPQVLWGTSMHEVWGASMKQYWKEKFLVIDARAIQVKGMEKLLHETSGEARDDLALALQCKARGWDRLAQALFQRAFPLKDGTAARTTLLSMACDFLEAKLSDPDSDWATIAPRLKKLLALEKKLDNEYNRLLLHSLDAALVPSKAKPGSVAAMIDDLIQVPGVGGQLFQDPPDPRYARLLALGFDAVPDLIEHLDDRRLTRSRQFAFFNFPSYQLRVAHVVSILLEGLAGEYMGSGWPAQGSPIEKADARAWWEKARKVGEENYLLAHVFPENTGDQWANDHVLYLIAKKYPQHLPKIYRTLLDKRSQMVSWYVVKAIAESSLPRATKLESIISGARNKNLDHRWSALGELRGLDPDQFKTILLEDWETLPEATFAHLVSYSEDQKLWQFLEKVAKRSNVGLRVQILHAMDRDGWRTQTLTFLAAFLDDTAVYTGSYGKMGLLRKLEVRNVAALRMTEILEMPVEPQPDWNQEKWAKLRDQVRRAVQGK